VKSEVFAATLSIINKLTIGYIKDCKWKDASLEMLDSKWARQVGNRATNLSKMMASIDD